MSAGSRRTAFAAFMDRGAKFELQAFYWARSLIDSRTAERASDVCLFVPETLEAPPEWAARAGIRTVPIAYWDPRHKYCNKIGMWREELFAGYSHVCFTDCDLFFARRPDLPETDGIAAGVVDLENPGWSGLARVFTEAGLPLPEPVPVRWSADPARVTAPTNCNGGFYLVERRLISPLATAWARWANWLLDNPAVGSPLGPHVDQVAMALALVELKLAPAPLPRTVNVPTHLGRLPGTFPCPPTVLHYHGHLTNQGNLGTTGTAAVDEAIAGANRMIEAWKRDRLDNRVFWNARYALFPDLGSGIGSRGSVLEEKRRLLSPFAGAFRSTIDIGCGDIEATRGLPFRDYLGVDIADEALAIARAKEPSRSFVSMRDFLGGQQTADLVLCLDVLLHQSTRREYLDLIDLAVGRARDLVLISGYDAEPEFVSAIVYFHEPIGTTLKAHGQIRDVQFVGKYRDSAVYAAATKHGRLDAAQAAAVNMSAHVGSAVPD